MPSPFPGMDPYLENPAVWGGVHTSLIVAIQAELNRVLPSGLFARVDEYVWVHEDDEPSSRRVRPDVFIPDTPAVGGTPATVTAPTVEVAFPRATRRRRRYIRIADGRERPILTAIELLSPTNKLRGDDRDSYLVKRREYLASVNFVEIDLLRAGPRMPIGGAVAPDDYRALACRPGGAHTAAVWTWSVRDAMPVLSVPLRDGMPAAPLDLRRALDRVYDDGRYAGDLDYGLPPYPPLRVADAAWAAELLARTAGDRGN